MGANLNPSIHGLQAAGSSESGLKTAPSIGAGTALLSSNSQSLGYDNRGGAGPLTRISSLAHSLSSNGIGGAVPTGAVHSKLSYSGGYSQGGAVQNYHTSSGMMAAESQQPTASSGPVRSSGALRPGTQLVFRGLRVR
jgi:hypothetical protein